MHRPARCRDREWAGGVDDPQPDRHTGKIAIGSEFLGSFSAFQLGRLARIRTIDPSRTTNTRTGLSTWEGGRRNLRFADSLLFDSNSSSLSGSVPLQAGGAVRGNHMARPREFLRGVTNSSNPSPSSPPAVSQQTFGSSEDSAVVRSYDPVAVERPVGRKGSDRQSAASDVRRSGRSRRKSRDDNGYLRQVGGLRVVFSPPILDVAIDPAVPIPDWPLNER
jgi:hypothetical protein